jgi:hypothetical protein
MSSGNEFSYDYLLEDGSYAKIDEVLVGYRLPGTMPLLRRAGIESGRLALVGRNLYSFTKYRGYDPEIQGATVRRDDNGYPRYRTMTFQLELVF